MLWSNNPPELNCDRVVVVLVCPVWSVNCCLGEGGAGTTNSPCDRGLTPESLLRDPDGSAQRARGEVTFCSSGVPGGVPKSGLMPGNTACSFIGGYFDQ